MAHRKARRLTWYGRHDKPRERVLRDNAEALSRVLLVLRLQRPGELVVCLVGHDGEPVDERVVDPVARLIDRQAEPTADLLSFAVGGLGIVESADLELIGIVPTFA